MLHTPREARDDMLSRIADRRVRTLLLLLSSTLALIGLALLLGGPSGLRAQLLLIVIGGSALVLAALAWAAQRGQARRVMFPAMGLLSALIALDCWMDAGPRDTALLALPALLLAASIGSAQPRQLLALLLGNVLNVALLHAAALSGRVRFDAPSADAASAVVSLLLLTCSGLLVLMLVRDLRRLAAAWGEEHVRAEANSERASYLVDHDPLTGLPNRPHAQRALRESVAQGELALLLIDIDDFSAINAALGQAVGDELLCHLAEVLRAEVRAPDFAARFGDDEFLVLWRAAGASQAAESLSRALLQKMSLPWEALELDLQVRPLAGLALGSEEGRDAEALLAAAQRALAAAKRDHTQPLRLAGEAAAASELSQSLHGAQTEWLCLPWQRVDGGRVLAVELVAALPPGGLPTAALLVQVQRQLQAAAQHALAWRLAGHAELRLRLRLPADFLKRGEVEQALQQVLDGGGLQAGSLELLLSLRSASEDPQALADVLDPVLRAGASLLLELDALPDQGLPALAPLPVAGLVLTAQALRSSEGQAAAWQRLGLPLQAAGVLGERELNLARSLGCRAVAAQALEFLVLLEHLGQSDGAVS